MQNSSVNGFLTKSVEMVEERKKRRKQQHELTGECFCLWSGERGENAIIDIHCLCLYVGVLFLSAGDFFDEYKSCQVFIYSVLPLLMHDILKSCIS